MAGSGAIREHGVVDRLTHDVDLFTNNLDRAAFGAAVDQLTGALRDAGHDIDEVRRVPQFAQLRLTTTDSRTVDVDLAVDWRERDPVTLAIGPVLSIEDAVGSKVGALYSRTEARDYIDVDAIRATDRFTDEELINAGAGRDPGFDRDMFAHQLEQVQRVASDRFEEYGVNADEAEALKERFTRWAGQLRGPVPPTVEPVNMVHKFANLDVPLRGSDLTKPPSSPSTSTGNRHTHRDRDSGLGRESWIVGYTWVSTQDQNLHSPTDALTGAGAARIFTDKLTGKNAARPGLAACLKYLRDNEGDVLLVYSTDRLGRSMTDLVTIVGQLHARGIQFRWLTEPFDTTTAGGEPFFHIIAAFAQMNGRIISERTTAGLVAAKARGRVGGRPTLMTPARIAVAQQMRVDTRRGTPSQARCI